MIWQEPDARRTADASVCKVKQPVRMGLRGCYTATLHITRTICCLVATWVPERLVKVNAACKVECAVYPFKCTFHTRNLAFTVKGWVSLSRKRPNWQQTYVAKAWQILFIHAIELHCCPKANKNKSISHIMFLQLPWISELWDILSESHMQCPATG